MVYSGYTLAHADGKKFIPKMYEILRQTKKIKYPNLLNITSMEEGSKMSGNFFSKNIIVFSNPEWPVYGIYNDIDLENMYSDFNIFHHVEPMFVTYTKLPANLRWGAWQAMGFDKNSISSDPLFVDFSRNNFSLSGNSPAFKLGFEPIPIEKIGLYITQYRTRSVENINNIQIIN